MPTKPTIPNPAIRSEPFQHMIELLAVFTDAANRLAELETDANRQLLEILDDTKAEYAKFQSTMKDAEIALEDLARCHPGWFGEKKSIKTPYGTIKFHSSEVLDIPNEEATIILLTQEGKDNPDFPVATYVHKKEVLDIEALEKLPNADLQRFRIKRIRKENFSATPAKIDMGKAVKEVLDDATTSARETVTS